MKKAFKGILCIVLAVSFIIALTGCVKVNYIAGGTITAIKEINDGSWKETSQTTSNTESPNVNIEPFKEGTYGGVVFKTEADVVNYYVECYNNTKSQTAPYIDADGNTQQFYALVGEEKLTIESILVDGQENAMLNNVVPGIVENLFTYNVYGLPPCNNRNPELDNNNDDATASEKYDFRTSYFTPEDCQACNVVENSDGTITITIQPKKGSMSMRGGDSQGRFFEVLGDIGATVESISALSWASGTAEENVLVIYEGGTGVITIDPATKTVIAADYHMAVEVQANHANITVIKDKSGGVIISYDMHYPASDTYIMKAKSLTRA